MKINKNKYYVFDAHFVQMKIYTSNTTLKLKQAFLLIRGKHTQDKTSLTA